MPSGVTHGNGTGGNVHEWERLAGEPIRWFTRFECYRLLGPTRSLDAAYRAALVRSSGRVGGGWREAAKRWRWTERAEAWDLWELAALRAADEERRRVAREARIELLQRTRVQADAALSAAHLEQLTEEEARAMLGSLRMLLFDTLKAERLELGEPTEIIGDVDVVRFRADELAKAEEELGEWRKGRGNGNGSSG